MVGAVPNAPVRVSREQEQAFLTEYRSRWNKIAELKDDTSRAAREFGPEERDAIALYHEGVTFGMKLCAQLVLDEATACRLRILATRYTPEDNP
jgi:hypothetical protein